MRYKIIYKVRKYFLLEKYCKTHCHFCCAVQSSSSPINPKNFLKSKYFSHSPYNNILFFMNNRYHFK